MGILTGVGKSKPSAGSRKEQWAGDLFTGLGNNSVDAFKSWKHEREDREGDALHFVTVYASNILENY